MHRNTTHSEMALPRSSVITACIWDESNILRNAFDENILKVRIGATSDRELLSFVGSWVSESASWTQRIWMMMEENPVQVETKAFPCYTSWGVSPVPVWRDADVNNFTILYCVWNSMHIYVKIMYIFIHIVFIYFLSIVTNSQLIFFCLCTVSSLKKHFQLLWKIEILPW